MSLPPGGIREAARVEMSGQNGRTGGLGLVQWPIPANCSITLESAQAGTLMTGPSFIYNSQGASGNSETAQFVSD